MVKRRITPLVVAALAVILWLLTNGAWSYLALFVAVVALFGVVNPAPGRKFKESERRAIVSIDETGPTEIQVIKVLRDASGDTVQEIRAKLSEERPEIIVNIDRQDDDRFMADLHRAGAKATMREIA